MCDLENSSGNTYLLEEIKASYDERGHFLSFPLRASNHYKPTNVRLFLFCCFCLGSKPSLALHSENTFGRLWVPYGNARNGTSVRSSMLGNCPSHYTSALAPRVDCISTWKAPHFNLFFLFLSQLLLFY